MHTMPYLIKNSARVWCVQRKVPDRLQAAVARVLGGKKQTQRLSQEVTRDEGSTRGHSTGAHALADIDRSLREAEALARQQPPRAQGPLRTTLNELR